MALTEAHVHLLVAALGNPHVAFILGAGASVPQVPLMRELIRRVLQDFRNEVHSFIPPDEHEPTHFVFADQAGDEEVREKILGSSIATLRFLVAKYLQPPHNDEKTEPPQYALLSQAITNRPVINYNVDGLAERHCPRLSVNSVHGQIPTFVRRIPLQQAVRLTQDGIEIVPQTAFWLPEPEKEGALFRTIDTAYRRIRSAAEVVIIGYSFGATGSGLSDSVSFNAITEYFADMPVRILVVDPAPRELAGFLAESLRNADVTGVPVYWNLFAESVFATTRGRGIPNSSGIAGLARKIVRHYEMAVGRTQ